MANYPSLDECKIITSVEYCELVNPIFQGQTRCDENNMYYMCWESEGKLYKTHNKL
jgi:hypothetical protein